MHSRIINFCLDEWKSDLRCFFLHGQLFWSILSLACWDCWYAEMNAIAPPMAAIIASSSESSRMPATKERKRGFATSIVITVIWRGLKLCVHDCMQSQWISKLCIKRCATLFQSSELRIKRCFMQKRRLLQWSIPCNKRCSKISVIRLSLVRHRKFAKKTKNNRNSDVTYSCYAPRN